MPYQMSMMGWVGSDEDFCGLGWVGSRNFGLGRVLKSDPWPTLDGSQRSTNRSNFLPSDFSALEELFDSADSALFRAVLTIPEHVLHPLLPPRKKTGYNLRKRSHGLMLPEAKSSFLRNNFLVRMFYTDVYRHFSAFTLLFDLPSLRLSMTFNKETDW